MAKRYSIETAYSEQADITFIYEVCEDRGEVVSEEIIGFYHGKPTPENTNRFCGKLKIEY